MPVAKPATGQSVIDYVANKELWSDIIDMLGWWNEHRVLQGGAGGAFGKCLPFGWNDTAGDMLPGQLAYLESTRQPSADTPDIQIVKYRPVINLVAPEWHSKIDRCIVLHKGILTADLANIQGPQVVPALGTLVDPADKYVMVDPADPTKLRTSTSGIFGLLGTLQYDAQTVLLVDTTVSQPVWRYTLTGSFSGGTATANLLRLNGDVYGSVTLTDLANIGSCGATGYCLQVGNKFVPIPNAASRIFRADEGIPARSGSTAGVGDCQLISATGAVLTDTIYATAVHNVSNKSIPSGAYVIAVEINGYWYTGGSGGSGASDAPTQRWYCLLGTRPGPSTSFAADPRETNAYINNGTLVRLSSDPFSENTLTGVVQIANTLNLTGVTGDGAIIEYNQSTSTYFLAAVFPATQRRLWVTLYASRPNGLAATVQCTPAVPIDIGDMPAMPFDAKDIFNVAVNGKVGHRALVEYNLQAGEYYIIESEHIATRIRGTIYADFTNRADFEVTPVTGLDGITPGGPLTVVNRWGWESGSSGMDVEILWDTVSGEWYPNNLDCPDDPTPTYF